MVQLSTASRRTVLGGALATTLLAAMAPNSLANKNTLVRPPGNETMIGVPFDRHETVRVGVIGVGNRGNSMTIGWSAVPGATVVAVCDIRKDRATNMAANLQNRGRPRPADFGGTADAYKTMLNTMDLDLVFIATPWEFHHAHGKAAMEAGAHVMVELPIATELAELWDLVDTSERTRKHLMLAENCSYGRNELAMLKMAHEGVFGDVTNGHGGYLHDLRELLFADGYYTDDWRRKWHTRSTASFYAMHGLAPIAAAMDINRGDRMKTLSATATPAKGLADYRARKVPKGHRSWNEEYINGDLVTCMIGTEKGRIIRAEHDVSTPRPYSRINSLAGSRGLFEDYAGGGSTGARVYLEPDHGGHNWADFAPSRDKFDHWLWKKVGDDAAANGGHGGMDYILQWRTIQSMRTGTIPDIDVYDSAAWCAPVPLSVKSLADGGRAVDIPDFTRGGWVRPRLGLDSVVLDMPAVV